LGKKGKLRYWALYEKGREKKRGKGRLPESEGKEKVGRRGGTKSGVPQPPPVVGEKPTKNFC